MTLKTESNIFKIPRLSHSSYNILKRLEPELPYPAPIVELGQRIRVMQKTQYLLRDAQNNETHEKIHAFIKTMLAVTVVAAIITSLALCGGGVGLIYLGTQGVAALASASTISLIALSFLAIEPWQNIQDIESRSPDPRMPWYLPGDNCADPRALLALFGGGVILPTFEACTRVSRLKRVIEKQREDILKRHKSCHQLNRELSKFCTTHYRKLRLNLNKEMLSVGRALKRNKTHALSARYQILKKAKMELSKIAKNPCSSSA